MECEDAMRTREAKKLTREALNHLKNEYPDVYDWAEVLGFQTFDSLNARRFLSEYCYCVYTAGMNMSVIQAKFPAIKKAFHNFEAREVVEMKSHKPVLKVFKNEWKARSVLHGSKAVYAEGFKEFKERLLRAYESGKSKQDFTECLGVLQELKGCGPVISRMLAKNIGLIDISKDDRWLRRAADLVNARSVSELSSSMSKELSLSEALIDTAIFQYGRDKKLGGRHYNRNIL
jgi:3-methyladenine DNA glycosylase Tag